MCSGNSSRPPWAGARDVLRPLEHRDGLGVGALVRERVDLGPVVVEPVGLPGRRAEVLLGELGQEAPAAVGVADDDGGAAGGLAAQLVGREVARVEERPVGGQGAEGGERGDALGAAVDHGGGPDRLDVHQPAAGAQVVAADLRLGLRGGQAAAGRGERPDGPVGARRAPEALAGERRGGRGGVDRTAAHEVVVRAADDRPDAHEPQERQELPGVQALLLDEAVRRHEQVRGVRVGVRRLVPDGHRAAGEARQDRVDRAAPVVVAEDLARAGPSRGCSAPASGRGPSRPASRPPGCGPRSAGARWRSHARAAGRPGRSGAPGRRPPRPARPWLAGRGRARAGGRRRAGRRGRAGPRCPSRRAAPPSASSA